MAEQTIVIPKGLEVQYEEWKLAPGVRVGGTLYCSGQLGIGPDGALPEDPEAQFVNAFEAVGAVLEAAGGGFSDMVELTSFHVGLRQHLDLFQQVKERFVDEPYPAHTAVGVAELGLPGALVELKATAVLGD
ncbi:MAG: RidA family protein [Deltaproteobacteria bacterium]|nr:RidA family protein [Deltaproteobacteria bacterium]